MSSKLTSRVAFRGFLYARTLVSAPSRSYCILNHRFLNNSNNHVGISSSRIAALTLRSPCSVRSRLRDILRCSAYSTEGSNNEENGTSGNSDSANTIPKAVEDCPEIDRCEDTSQMKTDSSPKDEASESSADVGEGDSASKEDHDGQTWVEDDGIVIYTDKEFLTKRQQKIMQRRKPKLEDIDGTAPEATVDQFNLRSLLQNIQRQQDKLRDKDHKPQRTAAMSIEELVEFLRQDNARGICVIAVPPEKDYVTYFVVCSGTGSRHIGRMADHLANELKLVRVGHSKRRVRVEGRESHDWMAVDLGDIAVHFMSDEKREEMELEKLWALGEEYDDQCRAMAMNYEESLLMELK